MAATAAAAVLEPFASVDDLSAAAGLPSSTPLTVRTASACRHPASDAYLLYLGTAGGKLLLFSVHPGSKSTQFLRLLPVASSSVSSVLPLPEIGRVLVLCGGFLYFGDALLTQPMTRLGHNVKEVSAFAKRIPWKDATGVEGVEEPVVRTVGVSFSGRQLLYKLSGGARHANGVDPVVGFPPAWEGGTGCFVAAASGKNLVLMEFEVDGSGSLDSSYAGVSITVKEITAVSDVRKIAWVGDSIFIGTSNGYSLVSSSTGRIHDIFALPESSGLPLVKPLIQSNEVLLLVDNVGVVSNGIGQPVGGTLVFGCLPESIAEMGSYIVVAGEGQIEVYRRKTGSRLQSVSFLKGGSGPLTLACDVEGSGEIIVVAMAHKVVCFRKVPADERIKLLLRKKNYNEAIHLAEDLESDGEITKDLLYFVHAQVGFLLFFDLRFEDAVNQFLLSESMVPSEVFPFIMRRPNRWSELVPRNRYWGLHPPPVPLEEVIEDGLMAVQRALFLKKAGVDAVVDEEFLLHPPSKAELLDVAIKSLIRYLCASREKKLSSPLMEGVDTLLMYLYRALDLVDNMEALASSENCCAVEELELLLDGSGHLRTLAYLYGSKGMPSKALNIWCKLAKNYTSELRRVHASTLGSHILDGSIELQNGRRIAASEASEILKLSSDQELVLENIGWISDVDQDLAVAVLTSEKRGNHLSPEKVLSVIAADKVRILQRYLQWLIEDQDCDDPQYHTSYALLLAKSALEAVQMDADMMLKQKYDDDDMGNLNLDSGSHYSFSERESLQLFLQASDLYDPEEVLEVITGTELWLEKAILYRKMGQENIVLQILALKLEDSEAAEQYCAELGRDDAYIQLLDLYLNPQNGREPMFTAAVRLLHNHGKSLDPLQVLDKLSPCMPLQLASDTIVRMLRARVHHHHQGQIVHNLSRAINLDTKLTRLEERSRHVQLDSESTCDSCHARLGTKLFVMYPDDSVVCYRCYRNQGDQAAGRPIVRRGAVFKPGWLVTR